RQGRIRAIDVLSRSIGREGVQDVDVAGGSGLPDGSEFGARIAVPGRAIKIAVGKLNRAQRGLEAIGTGRVVGVAIKGKELRDGRRRWRLRNGGSRERKQCNASEKWLHRCGPG